MAPEGQRSCLPVTPTPTGRDRGGLRDPEELARTRRLGPGVRLAVELGDHLAGVDLNPVMVGPSAAYVVDALVLPL